MDCNGHVLLNGVVEGPGFKQIMTYPLVLFNCSDFADNIPLYNVSSAVRDGFPNGVVTICSVVSAVAVAAWSLVLLLILSTTPKSYVASLLTLFYAVMMSVVLSKTTSLLSEQFRGNFQDAAAFESRVMQHEVTFSLKIVVVLLTTVTFGEIACRMVSHRTRIWVKGTTVLLFVTSLVFRILEYTSIDSSSSAANKISSTISASNITNNLYSNNNNNSTRTTVKHFVFSILAIVSSFATFIFFSAVVVRYVYIKRNMAFQKPTFALSCFALVVMVCPIVFYLMFLVSDKIDNWAVLLTDFLPILVAIVVWELYYKICKVEKVTEMKTILGRAIMNDEAPKGSAAVVERSFTKDYFRNPLLKKSKKKSQLHGLTEIRLDTPVGGTGTIYD